MKPNQSPDTPTLPPRSQLSSEAARREGARIAVAGGTGLVGRLVVDAARRAGPEPVVIARSTGIDLVSGSGLDTALEGVDTVIDVSNVVTRRGSRAFPFFDAATSRLVAAAARSGVRHIVVLSIVGVDHPDIRYGYYRGKVRQEQVVRAGSVPWTIVRTTQFHEFAGQLLDSMGRIAPIPHMLSQPVAAVEVADHLLRLAAGEPQGMAAELAGPRQESMLDMVRAVAHTRRPKPLVLRLPMPGAMGRALASRALLPDGDGPRGRQTFAEWLVRAPR